MEYTKVSANAFDTLQINAGIVVANFQPGTGWVTGVILGADCTVPSDIPLSHLEWVRQRAAAG